MKHYKEVKPEITINRIKDILSAIGLETQLKNTLTHNSHSCRISIVNKYLQVFDFGTNGKGMSRLLSMASGYAELLERIQNHMIFFEAIKYSTNRILSSGKEEFNFLKKIFKENDININFRYYPDEKFLILENKEFKNILIQYFPNAFSKDFESGTQETKIEVLTLPFYSVKLNKTLELPYEYLRFSAGSTGMCAGNTPSEAISQGICEILERYAIQKIYKDKIKPPEIQRSFFKGSEILLRLTKLERKKNLYFKIFDCSLGFRFPIIGLLLIDRNNNTYTFRIGSDFFPEVALERCFTEIYQGYSDKLIVFNKIDLSEEININEEYNKSLINGNGKFPFVFYPKDSNYKFTGFDLFTDSSNNNRLKMLSEKIINLGFDIYIRDNSFLGFPCYYIYIPGLSDRYAQFHDFISSINESADYFSINPKYKIQELSFDQLKKLATKIEQDNSEIISLFPYNINSNNRINWYLLLTMIYLKVKNNEKAYKNIVKYITYLNDNGYSINSYYYCLRDYLFLLQKVETHTNDYMRDVMISIYGKNLVKEIEETFSNSNEVFRNFDFPNCFNCEVCKISHDCHYINIVKFYSHIQSVNNANKINQNELKHLFL